VLGGSAPVGMAEAPVGLTLDATAALPSLTPKRKKVIAAWFALLWVEPARLFDFLSTASPGRQW